MDEAKFTFSLKLGDGSLTVRADTKAELDQLTEQANEFLREQSGPTAIGTGTGSAPAPAGAAGSTTSTAGATDTSKGSSGDMPQPPVDISYHNAVQKMVDDTKARQAEVDAKIAQQKVTEHLGPGEEAASEALLKAAAKKKGVSIEDLGLISHNEAKKILKGGE